MKLKEIHATLRKQETGESNTMPFRPVVKQVNAEKNASALPQGRRHPKVLKRFAMALFIYTGPLPYATQSAAPSSKKSTKCCLFH